ncbi:MAG TPA: STAS domain-containing protein [Steroidobacteraceae bacterium]|jgi:anti-anti-sigma factor
MELQVNITSSSVQITGELTVYTCAAASEQICAALAASPELDRLDLSRVSEIDTAGLQTLLAARKYAATSGRHLRIANPSSVVAEVLELCRLTQFGAVETTP